MNERRRSPLRRTLPALAAVAGSCLVGGTACADQLDAVYSIRLVGLPIGVGSVNATLTPRSYTVEARGKLTGLVNLVVNARGAATGRGGIVDGRISPAAYATTAVNATTTRTVRMAIAGNAVQAVEISPPFDERPDRIPLSDADRRNIVDPVGGAVIPAVGPGPITSQMACNRTIPVFDGYTRFDITLTYVGERDVSAKGYAGKAAVCAVRYTPIAGHRRDRPATRYMAENRDIEVWLAPVNSARVFMPFRVSARTMIGTVVVEATQFLVHKNDASEQGRSEAN